MYLISIALAVMAAFYASNISTRRADEFINGPRKDENGLNVTPGSGAFFDTLAPRYDLLNQIISMGYHTNWRRAAIRKILPANSVLDVSTGTADIAMMIAANRSIRVVGLDPSPEMLKIGRRKIADAQHLVGKVELVEGVAEAIPFEDDTFDAVIVAFGVRNFQDREKGLSEMVRVLRPGGKLAILELSLSRGNSVMEKVTRLFVTVIMPKIAGLVSGNEAAYSYLSDSMRMFPSEEEFTKMMKASGLTLNGYEKLSPLGKGPALYTGTKRSVGDS